MFGGVVWNKWSSWFQDYFVAAQNPDGSWPVPLRPVEARGLFLIQP